MATTTNLKTATVLAFERKLDPSDALLFSGRWDDRAADEHWKPIDVRTKSVRGTISNRLKTKEQDPTKLDAAIQNPNLQTVDVAALPAHADTLRAVFTLRVLGGAGVPSACNNADYQGKLLDTIRGYVKTSGFRELARRYAYNLANGRFLWRNRVGAEQVEVHIEHLESGQARKKWLFDAFSLTLRGFEAPVESGSALSEVAELVAQGLAGNRHVLLRITAFARIGAGQEVFPSQELILNRDNAGGKSKTLYKVGEVAGIHSQKIGNALRTIDTWYQKDSKMGPIAVEPYGSVTTQGRAFRRPTEKMDFYTLLDNWLLKDNPPELDQQHYVIATLIRGGVFGDAGKE